MAQSRFVERLALLLDVLAHRLERRPWIVVGAWSAFYFAITGFLASRKLLWTDEFLTLDLSRIAGLPELWTALLTGGDTHPPFFYRLTHLSLAVFGESQLALRLPAALGFWLMTLCLYVFVSRRTSPLFGYAAMLAPAATRAYDCAYAARGYGLVLGFSALALLAWQRATEGDRRRLALAGLAIGLAGAVSSHYYAVFVLLPLALGEAVRSVSLRRIDIPVWLALASPAAPLLAFLPVIRAGSGQISGFWAVPGWMGWLQFLTIVFSPTIVPAAGMLALLGLGLTSATSPRARMEGGASHPPAHETVMALALAGLPVLLVLLGKLVTNAFHWRYALPATLGWSILFGFVAHARTEGSRRAALALTLVLGCCFPLSPRLGERDTTIERDQIDSATELLRRHGPSDMPVAIALHDQFYSLSYYAPAEVARRLVYLADPASELRYVHHATVDTTLLKLRPWNRLNVAEYGSFLARSQPFLVYGYIDRRWAWLPTRLREDGFDLQLVEDLQLGDDSIGLLFRVTRRAGKAEPPL